MQQLYVPYVYNVIISLLCLVVIVLEYSCKRYRYSTVKEYRQYKHKFIYFYSIYAISFTLYFHAYCTVLLVPVQEYRQLQSNTTQRKIIYFYIIVREQFQVIYFTFILSLNNVKRQQISQICSNFIYVVMLLYLCCILWSLWIILIQEYRYKQFMNKYNFLIIYLLLYT